MDPTLWARATALFECAAELDGDERARYLDKACADDREVRRLVERMLWADTGTGDLLEAQREELMELLAEADEAPSTLGPYKVLREIGRGGMGTVYLGERADGRFDRAVALKVVRGPLRSERIGERFASEARILASLEHPNIARLYDAGVHDGRPYLVMEFVEGERIDHYCDARSLGVRSRLDLLRQVCVAAQFAHQNLVIHRDLKPSNILVTSDGSVRLLDFGVAKLMHDSSSAETTATQFGALTPEYASPEQIQGQELTTASDVYSLGVVLYELLTGRRPFETAPGDLAALGERASKEPTSPSAVVTRPHERRARDGTTETVEPETLGATRGTTPAQLRRLLKGDLDRIALKALRSDPAERYASAEALSEDLRRFLTGLPVSARGDSFSYRASTFVRRHRPGVATAVLVAVALATAAATATRQAQVARRQRDSATRAYSFLEDLITSPDPLRGAGVAADSVRMVDFIDLAARRIDTELTDEPQARARMLGVLGAVYLNLGRVEESVRVLESAVEANRDLYGDSRQLAEVTGRLGFALDQHGDRERGESFIREALTMMLAAEGAGSALTAEWQEYLGRSLMDSRQLDEAEPYVRASYQTRLALLGPDDPVVARSLVMLSSLHSLRGEPDEALTMMEEVLRIYDRAGLSGNPDYAISEANLALMYQRAGRMEDADHAATEALGKLEATLGPTHFLTGATFARLANVRDELGRTADADSLFQRSIATLEAGAAGNLNLPVVMGDYAGFLRRHGRLSESEAAARRALGAAVRIVGESHPVYAGALLRIGDVARDQGRVEEAVELQGRAHDILTRTLGPENPQTHRAAVSLARSWMASGLTAEAESLLLRTHEAAVAARGPEDRGASEAARALVELYEAAGRGADADRYRPAGGGAG